LPIPRNVGVSKSVTSRAGHCRNTCGSSGCASTVGTTFDSEPREYPRTTISLITNVPTLVVLGVYLLAKPAARRYGACGLSEYAVPQQNLVRLGGDESFYAHIVDPAAPVVLPRTRVVTLITKIKQNFPLYSMKVFLHFTVTEI